jgi:hypothetical protein
MTSQAKFLAINGWIYLDASIRRDFGVSLRNRKRPENVSCSCV